MAKTAYYEATREVRTFVDLNHAADVLLKTAREVKRGSYYTLMSSLLMTAFTFEAYMNHLGQLKLPFWENIDSIRVLDKYSVLCKQFAMTPNMGVRPYQTLNSLFRFRNAIAHGKSELLEKQAVVPIDAEPHEHSPRTKWEEYVTEDNADRARQDVSKIIAELHEAAGLGKYPFTGAASISSISVRDESGGKGPSA